MSDEPIMPTFDPSTFNTEAYVRRVEKPWGWELHWVRADAPYMGKIMHINQGAMLSMQIHDEKEESYFLMNGRALLIWENSNRELIETELQPGQGYATKVGQRHRIKGITDCDVIEASTPEKGTTWRLEDAYNRPNETPEERQLERA
jgi:mannose-6-phosphate isomerase